MSSLAHRGDKVTRRLVQFHHSKIAHHTRSFLVIAGREALTSTLRLLNAESKRVSQFSPLHGELSFLPTVEVGTAGC